jgi:MFS family permease
MNVFGIVAAMTFLAISAAPTPLYRLYQEDLHISSLLLTVIFSSYSLSLLVALLTVGSLSDYIGRKPVIFAALIGTAVAMAMFIEAHSATTLIIARIVQGFSSGAATTALAAAILDTDRTKGPILNAVTPFAGLTFGSIGSSSLVTFAPDPLHLVFIVLLAVSLLLAAALIFMPETAKPQRGAWASLKPHVSVPTQARAKLLRVTPVVVAAWALGGFYFSLMPSLVRIATGLSSPMIGGIVVTALSLGATVGVIWYRNANANRSLIVGTATFAAGVAITLAGINAQLVPVLLAGTIISGFGFGGAFAASVRTVMPLASATERAGLLSAFYIECYLAFALPAIAVDLLAPVIGLPTSAYFYGAAIIVLAVTTLVALRGERATAAA